jgi:hypothetical protein
MGNVPEGPLCAPAPRFRYYGDLLSSGSTNQLCLTLLRELFQLEGDDLLQEMATEILDGEEEGLCWRRVMRVPSTMQPTTCALGHAGRSTGDHPAHHSSQRKPSAIMSSGHSSADERMPRAHQASNASQPSRLLSGHPSGEGFSMLDSRAVSLARQSGSTSASLQGGNAGAWGDGLHACRT